MSDVSTIKIGGKQGFLAKSIGAATGRPDMPNAIAWNVIKDYLPDYYRSSLPEAEAGSEVSGTPDLAALALNNAPEFWNSWVDALTRISKVLINSPVLENPLAKYKRGLIPNGKQVEELVVDAAVQHIFDPSVAQNDLYTISKPVVSSLIHSNLRDAYYPQTILNTKIQESFTDFSGVDTFVQNIIQSMTNGNNHDDFELTKRILSKAVAKNLINTVSVPDPSDFTAQSTDDSASKIFQANLLNELNLMCYPAGSRSYNRAYGAGQPGVLSRTSLENVVVFIRSDVFVSLGINFFAQAFHLDQAQTMAKIQVIDYFPDVWSYQTAHVVTADDISAGYVDGKTFPLGSTIPAGSDAVANATGATFVYSGDNILALAGDQDMFVMYDFFDPYLASQANTFGRYSQLSLHVKGIRSFSPIVNSFAIVKEPSAADTLTATPTSVSVAVGATATSQIAPTSTSGTAASSDETIATVTVDSSNLATITGVAEGTANIVFTANDGSGASITIPVTVTAA